ncbi:MAG: AraC family transcriptional regulator [Pseudobacteriovorax sp.]|nr:AraC family transcriptional regulator [Pseudobacteriovorax sp.]
MDSLLEHIDALAKKEGYNQTHLDGVGVYRVSEAYSRKPFVYSQGIIFCFQGQKKVYWEDTVYVYDQQNYMVVTVPLPLECQSVLDSNQPLLAVVLDIDIQVLSNIIHLAGSSLTLDKLPQSTTEAGLYTGKVKPHLLEMITRLLQCLHNQADAKILGPGIYQEILYYLLKQQISQSLHALTLKNTKLSKIELALKEIHGEFSKPILIDSLAKSIGMSPSAFHRAFKEVTATSPIQYLKKIRLDKARAYLIQENLRVQEAARKVGYESVSQFSREFKRHYGVAPKDITS